MRIAALLYPYGETKPAGLARSVFAIIKHMVERDAKNQYTVLFKNEPPVRPAIATENWQPHVLNFRYFWLSRGIRKVSADLFVFLTPVIPLFLRRQKFIVVVFDFAYKYVRATSWKVKLYHYLLHYINRNALRRATKIVAISQFTKLEIQKYFGIAPEKITVIPLAYEKISALEPVPVQQAAEPFFLFAGVIKERKNVFNIVRAFNEFRKTDTRGTNLVIAGKGGGAYLQKILDFVLVERLGERVIFVDHMNDNQMAFLYQHAIALVFPSFLEGFGMPILEAMDSGLPVITANRGATGEVAGDGALLVNPDDFREIARAMVELARAPDLAARLKQRGREIAANYSWEKSADQYLTLFEELQ